MQIHQIGCVNCLTLAINEPEQAPLAKQGRMTLTAKTAAFPDLQDAGLHLQSKE